MVVDNINGIFETTGGIFVALSVLRLHNDKKVRGVSIIATTFFMVWGWWNIYYYPAIEQWWSATGAAFVALVNTIWLCQMIHYTRKERYARKER